MMNTLDRSGSPSLLTPSGTPPARTAVVSEMLPGETRSTLKGTLTEQLTLYRQLIHGLLLTVLESGKPVNAAHQATPQPAQFMQQIIELDKQLHVSISDCMCLLLPSSFLFQARCSPLLLDLLPFCIEVLKQKQFHDRLQELDARIEHIDRQSQSVMRQLHASERGLSVLVECARQKVDLARVSRSKPVPLDPLLSYASALSVSGGSGAPSDWEEGSPLLDHQWPFPASQHFQYSSLFFPLPQHLASIDHPSFVFNKALLPAEVVPETAVTSPQRISSARSPRSPEHPFSPRSPSDADFALFELAHSGARPAEASSDDDWSDSESDD